MERILDRIARGEVLVADGAMGTMLMAMGLPSGQCPESINLQRPDWLEDIARRYLEAGADILQTNTFGGSPLKLAQYGLQALTVAINAAAVAAVRRVAGERAYLAASCGPSGRILEPYGDVSEADMADNFRRQARALCEAGVDLVCVETMSDLREAVLAVRAFREAAPDLAVAATLTFDRTSRGFFTIMGNTVAEAVPALTGAGADILGSNCGHGLATMVEIAAEFRRHWAGPLLFQANAGLPGMRDGVPFWPETPEDFAAGATALLALRVNLIGGCCGTTPAHTAAIRQAVDRGRRPCRL